MEEVERPMTAVALLILAVGAALAAAIAVIARRRPIHPGDAAFEAHLADLATGPGWLPPPGWDEEQARLNAEHSAGCQHRTCTGCGWAFDEHVFADHVRGRCPGGDHDDTFTAGGQR